MCDNCLRIEQYNQWVLFRPILSCNNLNNLKIGIILAICLLPEENFCIDFRLSTLFGVVLGEPLGILIEFS